MARYDYAADKLSLAVEMLATLPGDVRERLAEAYLSCSHLLPNHLPKDCHTDWQWIATQVTKRGPVYDHKGNARIGSVDHTLQRMQKRTAAKIAQRLFDLYLAVAHVED